MRRAERLSLSFTTIALAIAACSAASAPLSDEERPSADAPVVESAAGGGDRPAAGRPDAARPLPA